MSGLGEGGQGGNVNSGRASGKLTGMHRSTVSGRLRKESKGNWAAVGRLFCFPQNPRGSAQSLITQPQADRASMEEQTLGWERVLNQREFIVDSECIKTQLIH